MRCIRMCLYNNRDCLIKTDAVNNPNPMRSEDVVKILQKMSPKALVVEYASVIPTLNYVESGNMSHTLAM